MKTANIPMSPARAFTLIELLTVIAIIGILAAIIIPVVGKVRMTARKGKAISDLRGVGIGILAYANERKDQRVPGPGSLAIEPSYGRPNPGTKKVLLPVGLAPYMGYRDPQSLGSTERAAFPALVCPGMTSLFPGRDLLTAYTAYHYIQNYTLTTRKDANGGSNARVLGEEGTPDTKIPVTLPELDTYGGPARVWVLTNLDRALPTDNPKMASSGITGAGWYKSTDPAKCLPETPVWGNSRLRLYFDAHVASVPRNADP